jgi:pyruvate dehydrogenase E1 component beta subunit
MPEINIRDALQMGHHEALEGDPNVLIMGEDIGAYGGAYSVTAGLLDEFGPERVRDTPISEAAFVGAGIGAAVGGLKPIIEYMNLNFALLAFDQMINIGASLRYMSGGQVSVPIVYRAPTGGGIQLAATHSRSYENWLAAVPGMKVVAPSTPADALGLLRSALSDPDPVLMVEHVLMYARKGMISDEHFTVPIGEADIRRPGSDVTIVSYHHAMITAMDVADKLTTRDVSAEVIDLRTLRPLDMPTVIESVKKTNRVLLLEENWKTGGIMGEVAAQIQEEAFDFLDGPIVRVGAEDVPHPYNRGLEQSMIPSADKALAALSAAYGI